MTPQQTQEVLTTNFKQHRIFKLNNSKVLITIEEEGSVTQFWCHDHDHELPHDENKETIRTIKTILSRREELLWKGALGTITQKH